MNEWLVAGCGIGIGIVGWTAAAIWWRQRRLWQLIARQAIDLNTQVLAANQAVLTDLGRAVMVLNEHGILPEYLARTTGQQVDPPSSGIVH